jgi:hypothetical protein
MEGRGLLRAAVLLGTVLILSASASAQERSAPAGAVVVRPVQVREVRVDSPPHGHHDQRSSSGLERPTDPGFLSRTPDSARARSVSRPQGNVTPSRRPIRGDHRGRNRFYSFKPRFNVGFGVVVGYPIIYPYAYPYDPFFPVTPSTAYAPVPPARNTYSNVDSLSTPGNVAAAAPLSAAIACEGSTPCGGVSFDISPGHAQVYVDGSFAGVADDFDAMSEPLLLVPGHHYIELRLAGYRSASFDVTITSSEVTPYEGTLERLRLRTP